MFMTVPIGVSVDPHVLVAHRALIRDAMRHADLSLEKAALYMNVDRGLLSRQLNGVGHLSWKRLLALPPLFWRWYGVLLAQECGMPRELQRAARLAVALIGRKRQLKIDAAQLPQRRRA